jgi:hypothetical protein
VDLPPLACEVRDENKKLVYQLSFRDAIRISGRADDSDD